MWKKHRPDFLFLSETKKSSLFLEKLVSHFGYKNLKTVHPIGCCGGLALFYNFNVSIIFDIEAI